METTICDQCDQLATLTIRGVTNAWAENGVYCYSLGELKSGCNNHPPNLAENETAEYWENKVEQELQRNAS